MRRPLLALTALGLTLMLAAPAQAAHPEPAHSSATAPTTGANARYAVAGGCYALRSQALNRRLPAGPFRLQATELGRYLLYGPRRDFLTASGGTARMTGAPSSAGEWDLNVVNGAFRISSRAAGKPLAVNPANGALVVGGSGAAALFQLEQADGCAVYPEVEVNATGTPAKGLTPYTEASGLLEAHMHMMAYEYFGGQAHCGRPWHRYGAPYALRDCPDHYPNGGAAILENLYSYNTLARQHDPVGWPTFKDWPAPESVTHEQSYYKWVERAWRGGLRVYVTLFVENRVLCEIYPYKHNSCDEMESVRLQARRIRELENYIDAQSGGPGKGWFRIVDDPYEARRVANAGKLAVVQGIEVSEPLGCRIYNGRPFCNEAQIDSRLDEMHRLGVRDMELTNKYDNALGGVAGDAGTTGAIVNTGNRYATGRFWQMKRCTGPPDETDRDQPALFGHNEDEVIANGLSSLLPLGTAPVYPQGPLCNAIGLTRLGEHLVKRMIAKRMIVDPDHLSVLARKGVMALLEQAKHSGVVSSHSWSTPEVIPRIYDLGGVITPYAGDSKEFVEAWRNIRTKASKRFFFGFGFGADMNGLGKQGNPRNGPNPVSYPFRSIDGKVTFDRQRSGVRRFDINSDGVAHYGLYPDWVEDLRRIAGDRIVKDLARGSEAYIQMWERADGVAPERCRSARGRLTRRGLGRHRLRMTPTQLLRRAGQPTLRRGRVFRYCVRGRGNRRARVAAVFTRGERLALVATSARRHRLVGPGGLRVTRGTPVARLRGEARRAGRGLYIRRARGGVRFVYRVRRGRVRYVAVASRSAARSTRRLRAYLRLAGLR